MLGAGNWKMENGNWEFDTRGPMLNAGFGFPFSNFELGISIFEFLFSSFQFLFSQPPGLAKRCVPFLGSKRLESCIRIEGNFTK